MTTVSGTKRSNRAAERRLSNQLQAEQRISAQWKTRIASQESRVADLQSQIDRGVPTIGGPLQLVKITHQGLTWIDQPLICSK